MRSYQDCIRERFEAYGEQMPDMAAEQALGDNSVVRRFLEAAGRAEVEGAQKTLRQLRSEPEDRAIAQIIEERRGDTADLLLQSVAQGTSALLGRAMGKALNQYVALAPGVALVIAGLAARQPYAVRAGLVASGVSWINGAREK